MSDRARVGFSGEVRLTPELLIELIDPTSVTQPPLPPGEAVRTLRGRSQPKTTSPVPTIPSELSPGAPTRTNRQTNTPRDNNMTSPTTPGVVDNPRTSSPSSPSSPTSSSSPSSPSVAQTGGNSEGTTTTEAVKTEPKPQEVIVQLTDQGVTLFGAEIPKEVATQVAVTALLTTATVTASNMVGNFISRQVAKLSKRMESDTVSVQKNPFSKFVAAFRDDRPKIIIRRVHRGIHTTAMIERFEANGHNILLKPINMREGDKISGLIDILKTQDPDFTKNLDIRIDENLKQYFHEEEVAIWKDYFTKHFKLFSGVQ